MQNQMKFCLIFAMAIIFIIVRVPYNYIHTTLSLHSTKICVLQISDTNLNYLSQGEADIQEADDLSRKEAATSLSRTIDG